MPGKETRRLPLNNKSIKQKRTDRRSETHVQHNLQGHVGLGCLQKQDELHE